VGVRQPSTTLGLLARSPPVSRPRRLLLAIWYAPDVKRVAKMVRTVYAPSGWHSDEDTYELVQYRVQ